MKVQGHLMQVCFIEIHQVFAKKKLDTFLTEYYLDVNVSKRKWDIFCIKKEINGILWSLVSFNFL